MAQGQAFFSTNGPCTITSGGLCFSDGAGDYGNQERCSITVLQSTTLRVESFDTEIRWDYLVRLLQFCKAILRLCRMSLCILQTVDGTRYDGTTGPSNVPVTAGSSISWRSNVRNVASGFTICAQTAAPTQSSAPSIAPTSAAPTPVGPWSEPFGNASHCGFALKVIN